MKNTDEILWLNHLLKNGVVELRCFKDGNIKSGIYDSLELLVKNIKFAMTEGFTIYATLNPSNLKATNGKLRPFQPTTKNKDITRIKTLFFDFDKASDEKRNSTQEELIKIEQKSDELVNFMTEKFGWPLPTKGFSGNGIHLLWDTDLSVEYAQKWFKGFYSRLGLQFSDDVVHFDLVVHNSARIARCLGSHNLKYKKKNTLCVYRDNFLNTEDLKLAIEALTPPKKKPKHFVPATGGDKKGIRPDHEIIAKIESRGLYISSPEADKHWIKCFNEAAHGQTTDSDSVLWTNPNGFYSYHCSHSHCSHLTSKDLQEFLG